MNAVARRWSRAYFNAGFQFAQRGAGQSLARKECDHEGGLRDQDRSGLLRLVSGQRTLRFDRLARIPSRTAQTRRAKSSVAHVRCPWPGLASDGTKVMCREFVQQSASTPGVFEASHFPVIFL